MREVCCCGRDIYWQISAQWEKNVGDAILTKPQSKLFSGNCSFFLSVEDIFLLIITRNVLHFYYVVTLYSQRRFSLVNYCKRTMYE